jgi:negative regulator of flagellin synthesis FlgM
MKIHRFGPMGVNPYQRNFQPSAANGKKGSKVSDQVEISKAAKQMQQASQLINERQAKVNELKIQVQNGTYKVDAKAVAKSMVNFYSNGERS